MKIKDEISGLMDDWHTSTHRCRGALGKGWELQFPAQNCNATLFPPCFCLNTGLYWGLCSSGSFTPPTAVPCILGKVAAFSAIPPLKLAHGWAGVCWGSARWLGCGGASFTLVLACASLPLGTGCLLPRGGRRAVLPRQRLPRPCGWGHLPADLPPAPGPGDAPGAPVVTGGISPQPFQSVISLPFFLSVLISLLF